MLRLKKAPRAAEKEKRPKKRFYCAMGYDNMNTDMNERRFRFF
jgi:hypothetical protein